MKAPEQNQGPGASGTREPPVFLTIFPSIMLPMFLAVMDQTIVATALPAIAGELGEVERTSWIVVSYLIAATIAAPIYGRLGDSFGRRRMMLVALSVFVVASLLCAAAPSMTLLSTARFLQGLGGGGLMTLSQALIGEAIPPRERARYQGYLAAVAVTANTFGPVVGGFLTEHFGWRSIFFISVPIGLAALALTLRLPTRVAAERLKWRADPGGLLFFAVFVATTLLALEQVQQVKLSALPLGAGMLSVGIIALVLLVWKEKRTESPLLPLGILRMPAIWKSDALAACHGGALVSLITFLPVYLQVALFPESTVVDEISSLNIGSRPASRKPSHRIEDLRAIPWVFSWAQCRLMLPGWYGFGAAVKAWLAHHPKSGLQLLQSMNQNWPFFRTLLSRLDMVLAKTDIAVASRYASLVDDARLRSLIFSKMRSELQGTMDALFAITRQKELLESNPTLRLSLRQRIPYLDPLNHMQVELLRRYRSGDRSESTVEAIHLTINGIAAGLKTAADPVKSTSIRHFG